MESCTESVRETVMRAHNKSGLKSDWRARYLERKLFIQDENGENDKRINKNGNDSMGFHSGCWPVRKSRRFSSHD